MLKKKIEGELIMRKAAVLRLTERVGQKLGQIAVHNQSLLTKTSKKVKAVIEIIDSIFSTEFMTSFDKDYQAMRITVLCA